MISAQVKNRGDAVGKLEFMGSVIFLLVFAGCVSQISGHLQPFQALDLANSSAACLAVGNLTGTYVYNNATMTWWFDLDTVKPGCSPACVVDDVSKNTSVNWRCTGAQPQPPTPPAASAPLVTVFQHPQLGQILTDKNGMTLYVFLRDDINRSNCYGACAAAWPPLTYSANDNLSGLPGVLGTITRNDNSTQVTYNGMPLYYFAKDKSPGDALGQNLLNIWFAAQPNMTGFPAMTYDEAVSIANASTCVTYGNLTSNVSYNLNTATWWIDLDTVKPGCAPACVVSSNQSADVNWRCTGLITNQSGSAPAANTTPVPVVKTFASDAFGDILVDPDGMALYVYTKDGISSPTCKGECASVWTPLFLNAGETLNVTGLGIVSTVAWQNGSQQVTYNGMPLYTYSADSPGLVRGNGSGSVWYVVKPDMTTFPSPPAPQPTYGYY